MSRIKQGILSLLILVVAAGCGYHLEGGGYLNENLTRVTVKVFENKSGESGAGVSFTNELIREITAKTDTRVVDDALRVITGTVTAVTFSTQSRSDAANVTERRVTAVVDVRLIDGGGEILWSAKGFSASESYTVSADAADDEASRGRAVDIIAGRVAERLVSRMKSNF